MHFSGVNSLLNLGVWILFPSQIPLICFKDTEPDKHPSSQIKPRPHTSCGPPQKVAFRKGNSLAISGKSRLVKYYHLARSINRRHHPTPKAPAADWWTWTALGRGLGCWYSLEIPHHVRDKFIHSKKSPTGPTERTPTPEYLIAPAIYLGVRW